MNTKRDKIKILLGLALLIFMAILFSFSHTQQNIMAGFASRTPTPEPIHDVFPLCNENVLEVLKGDTWDAIVHNLGVSKEHIVEYNRLESDTLSPGMVLLIPMCWPMPTPTVTPVK